MIQTQIKDDRGELVTLDHHDPRYWEGPYRYVPYPKLLFRAMDGHYQDDQLLTCAVADEQAHRAMGSDWKESPNEARAHYDAVQLEFARAAAEVAAAAQRMSAAAQAELKAAERASADHVIDVPRRVRKRPGARTKAEKAAALAAAKE